MFFFFCFFFDEPFFLLFCVGIFTADPRKVESAKLLPIISPEEAAELTYYGSEVIHPFTMEQVIRGNIYRNEIPFIDTLPCSFFVLNSMYPHSN